jgi:type IV secretory pathway VirB2 component (pilin)
MHATTVVNLGTILVLIGTILCGIAVFFGYRGEPRGRFWRVDFLLGVGAFLIGLGVLFGAHPLVITS